MGLLGQFVHPGQLRVEVVFQREVFNLLHRVKVDSVVVGTELLTLEKVDGRLVELEDHDLVEEVEALDVAVSFRDSLRQQCNLVHFAFLGAEE